MIKFWKKLKVPFFYGPSPSYNIITCISSIHCISVSVEFFYFYFQNSIKSRMKTDKSRKFAQNMTLWSFGGYDFINSQPDVVRSSRSCSESSCMASIPSRSHGSRRPSPPGRNTPEATTLKTRQTASATMWCGFLWSELSARWHKSWMFQSERMFHVGILWFKG